MTIPATSIFGSSVTLDVSTPAEPKLVIDLQDLEDVASGGDITNGGGIDDVSLITALTLDEYASKILMGLIFLHLQNQPNTNEDDSNGTYIAFDPTFDKGFITRNNVAQIEYGYTVNAYAPDTTASLDVDNIATT